MLRLLSNVIIVIVIVTFPQFECTISIDHVMAKQETTKEASVIASVHSFSKVECALECTRNHLCTDIALNKTSGVCLLLNGKTRNNVVKIKPNDEDVTIFAKSQEPKYKGNSYYRKAFNVQLRSFKSLPQSMITL